MRLSTVLHLIFIAVLLSFIACRERNTPVKVILNGHFSMVGNMPFAKLLFRADNGRSYEGIPAEAKKFIKLQGRRFRIEGLAGSLIMETADKKYSRRVYYIKNIKIISMKER